MLAFYLSLAESPEEKSKIEEIYHQYKKLIYHIAYSKLQKQELAEDAVHDVMLAVIGSIKKLQGRSEEEVKAFLCLVTRNVSVDILRKEHRRLAESLDDLSLAGGSDPQEQLGAQALADRIAALPALYRDVLELTAFYGFSVKEAAALLKITPATARKRLERARNLLRIALEKGKEAYV